MGAAVSLTPRQREVCELAAKGLTNKAIARTLGLSPLTVRDHISEAARRIPGNERARYKLILFILAKDAA